MTNLALIYRHIEEHQERHLTRIQEFLRQPSVSDTGEGIQACAELLCQYYRELGCEDVHLIETDGHPGVYAYYDAGAPRTLANYCMYDTMPVGDPQLWTSAPFAAHIVEQEPFGKRIVARGAYNSKGPYRVWLNALESILAVQGKLPVNMVFVAEGEEELGSPHLGQIVRACQQSLARADALLFCEANQTRQGLVEVILGYKGNIYFDLVCTTALWGRGSRRDIHSSLRPIVDNPLSRLVEAVASLATDDGNTVLISGLGDEIVVTPEDQLLLDQLAQDGSFIAQWKEQEDIQTWAAGLEDNRQLLQRYYFGNNLNLCGFSGGYNGDGAKTVIPHEALCKINIRLVPNQEPDEVAAKIRAHLDRLGYTDILMRAPRAIQTEKPYTGYTWSKTSPQAHIVQVVLETYRQYAVDFITFPHSPGSTPMYLFNRPPLNLPIVSAGVGHGGSQHAPNEYLSIEDNDMAKGLAACEKFYVDLLFRYAGQ